MVKVPAGMSARPVMLGLDVFVFKNSRKNRVVELFV